MSGFEPTAAGFDAIFGAIAASPTLRRIYAEVQGDEHQYSATSAAELRRVATLLDMGREGTFLDLACGRGGPGIAVLEATRASVVATDWSAAAVAQARAVARGRGHDARARFLVGDAHAIPARSGSLDGAISIDALQLLRDRGHAIREVARVLRPGARFVFTTCEGAPGQGFPARLAVDNAEPLRRAGFRIEVREESTDWLERVRPVFRAVLDRRVAIAAECGEASQAFFDEAERLLAPKPFPPRVLYAATRTS